MRPSSVVVYPISLDQIIKPFLPFLFHERTKCSFTIETTNMCQNTKLSDSGVTAIVVFIVDDEFEAFDSWVTALLLYLLSMVSYYYLEQYLFVLHTSFWLFFLIVSSFYIYIELNFWIGILYRWISFLFLIDWSIFVIIRSKVSVRCIFDMYFVTELEIFISIKYFF